VAQGLTGESSVLGARRRQAGDEPALPGRIVPDRVEARVRPGENLVRVRDRVRVDRRALPGERDHGKQVPVARSPRVPRPSAVGAFGEVFVGRLADPLG
jgi:hypothetical protein